jgi:hypothetical protein
MFIVGLTMNVVVARPKHYQPQLDSRNMPAFLGTPENVWSLIVACASSTPEGGVAPP